MEEKYTELTHKEQKQFTLEEYGRLISLLTQYQDNLIHEYHVRIKNDDETLDAIELCEDAIKNTGKCIRKVVEDLQYYLSIKYNTAPEGEKNKTE